MEEDFEELQSELKMRRLQEETLQKALKDKHDGCEVRIRMDRRAAGNCVKKHIKTDVFLENN